MNRRGFVHGVTIGLLLAGPLAAEAQPAVKSVRIGLLDYGTSNPSSAARWAALREQLRVFGYVEGQNVVFESRWADGQVSRLPALAAELVGAKVDLIVTATSEAARVAKQTTTVIPIVMATSGDPVEPGVVASLARPGGNITGVISLNNDLVGKRLELLKQMVPRAARVAILHDPDNRTSTLSVRAAQSAGKSLGVAVQSFDARGHKDLEAAFVAMKRAHVDAVILGVNTPFVADRKCIAELAIQNRLVLGVTIPPSLLQRADQVIDP